MSKQCGFAPKYLEAKRQIPIDFGFQSGFIIFQISFV